MSGYRDTRVGFARMGEVVQLDIFTVSTVDPPWRDNRDAMEYPFLSLQKGRTKPIEYQAKATLRSSVHAPAEIWPCLDLGLGCHHLRGLAPERRHRGRVSAVAACPVRAV